MQRRKKPLWPGAITEALHCMQSQLAPENGWVPERCRAGGRLSLEVGGSDKAGGRGYRKEGVLP